MPTSWKSLRHREGAATSVPKQIATLSAKDATEADLAFRVLRSQLSTEGAPCTAAAPALELLLAELAKSKRKPLLLALATEIAGGTRGWLGTAKRHAALVAPLLAQEKKLLALLDAGEAATRAGVAALFGAAPSLGERAATRLGERALRDPDPTVRASATLALAAVGGAAAEAIRACASSPEPLVRGAGAIAHLRATPSASPTEMREGLRDWLGWVAPRTGDPRADLPWFRGFRGPAYDEKRLFDARVQTGEETPEPATAGLVALAAATDRLGATVDLAFDLGVEATGSLARACAEVILVAAGFDRLRGPTDSHPYVAPFDRLTVEQQVVAKRLAGTWLSPQAGFGLPAAGECRRRWAGLAPAGPSDRVVTFSVEKKSRRAPFFRAWGDLFADAVYGAPVPPPIDSALDGIDRWQALVEFAADSYGGGPFVIEDSGVEAELRRFPHDAAFFARAGALAADLAARARATREAGLRAPIEAAASALLFLPFVRAARPLDPAWDVLVFAGPGDHAREVLSSLPPARREAVLWSGIEGEGPEVYEGLVGALEVLDLAPSLRIAENLARRLAHPKVRAQLKGFGRLARALERVGAVTQANPELRAVFATLR